MRKGGRRAVHGIDLRRRDRLGRAVGRGARRASMPATRRSPTRPERRGDAGRRRARPDARRDHRARPRRRRRSSSTGPTRRPRRRSAATSSSSATRSTRRSTGPRGSRRPSTAPSRFGPSTSTRRRPEMLYALLVYTDQSAWADLTEEEAAARAPSRCPVDRRLRGARAGRSGHARHRARRARPRPRSSASAHGERIVTDGPFAETKELIGGALPDRAARPRRGDPARRHRSRPPSTGRSRSGPWSSVTPRPGHAD